MSTDQISAAPKKRKATAEDVGFPPTLKPIITARQKPSLCTEQAPKLDSGIASTNPGIFTDNDNNNNNNVEESSEGCETPKSEEHRIPRILSCPPAPKKPRQTARRIKAEDYFYVSPRELKSVFNLSHRKKFQVR